MPNENLEKYNKLLSENVIDYDEWLALVSDHIKREQEKRSVNEEKNDKTKWQIQAEETKQRVEEYNKKNKEEYEHQQQENIVGSEMEFAKKFLSNIYGVDGIRLYSDDFLNDENQLGYYEMISIIDSFKNNTPKKYEEIVNKLIDSGVNIPKDFIIETPEIEKPVAITEESTIKVNPDEIIPSVVEETPEETVVVEEPVINNTTGLPDNYDNRILNIPGFDEINKNNDDTNDYNSFINPTPEVNNNINNIDNLLKPSEIDPETEELGKNITSEEPNKNNKPKSITTATEFLKNKIASLKNSNLKDIGKITLYVVSVAGIMTIGITAAPIVGAYAGMAAATAGAGIAAATSNEGKSR